MSDARDFDVDEVMPSGITLKRDHLMRGARDFSIVSTSQKTYDGDDRPKLVLHFAPVDEGGRMVTYQYVANASAINALKAGFNSSRTGDWWGGRVRLSFDPTVEMGGRQVGGIKLAVLAAPAPRQPAPPTAPSAPQYPQAPRAAVPIGSPSRPAPPRSPGVPFDDSSDEDIPF